MSTFLIYVNGETTAVLTLGGDAVHILKKSRSRYHLEIAGMQKQYLCTDVCCDAGVSLEVKELVNKAKAIGAKKVILRMGRPIGNINGLPVEDVSTHVGNISGGRVYAAW